ncbi:short chain dehydrogenase [Rhizoctonia solani]|uniref:Short chain dehydrogenase n=2 Tax=Rhizoctonia solani TaxID=456999 RepID=A0A8H8P5P4_9AGAM
MAAPPSSPVVLITGSSHGGIGYSLCETFAAKGCIVYASARRLETISSFTHPHIRPLIMDVTSDVSVHKAVEQIIEEAGRVDIVVANAGVPCHGPILDISIDDAQKALNTNVLGVLRLAQAVFPYMASRKRGTFITIGSVMGYNASPWAGMYAATKAAAHAITETLQMEAKALSPDIRVMLVVTGGVKSNIANNSTFVLPSTSLFQNYLPNIITRIQSSQTGPSMPTAEYAKGSSYGPI